MTKTLQANFIAVLSMLVCNSARGQFVSGSDGSDGAFSPSVNTQIDLSLATTAAWDTSSPVPGRGVYDADKWAVVFKYTTITIPQSVTITFKNHRSGAPVIWLATGNVIISGTVGLDGATGAPANAIPSFAEPGPGGFSGARGGTNTTNVQSSGGIGPGGGGKSGCSGGGGGYGTNGNGPGSAQGATYGSAALVPLIGGSGGGSTDCYGGGGGGGGGAILMAASVSISFSGNISAIGGGWGPSTNSGGGSGGAIRLVSNSISGTGNLRAVGGYSPSGNGGDGRIRLEANDISVLDGGSPPWTSSFVPGPIFPVANAPQLKATLVDNVAVPADPASGILTPDVYISNTGAATIHIEAKNVPLGTTVQVRVIPARGQVINVMSTPLTGTLAQSTASAQVVFPGNQSEVQLRANWTP